MTAVLSPAATGRDSAALLRGKGRVPSRRAGLLRTIGPALLVSAGYIDPGNWGTDVAAGAQYGLRLLWVVAAAMLAALFLQQLSARLGIAAGQDLVSLIRSRLPVRLRQVMSVPLLAALGVTEVVEVLGVVLGMQLLTGWSALPAAGAAAALVLIVLCLPGPTARRLVYGCLALIGVVYVAALCVHGGGAVAGHLRPSALPHGSLPVAVGLLGSVIMPHNILLHSALARDLPGAGTCQAATRRLLRGSLVTSATALALAFVINAAITALAAKGAGHGAGRANLSAIGSGLQPAFGQLAAILFALTLLASGLASATTGGMISVDVLARLVPQLTMPLNARRMLLLIPATGVVASPLPELTVLVWSQVVLTCALPVVLLPLLWFTSRRDVMGDFVVGRCRQLVALAITAALIAAGAASLCTL